MKKSWHSDQLHSTTRRTGRDTPQFGLIAEEVAKVNPALVLPDKEGKPYTVRYDAVNAMLLNEFLKARRQIDAQQKQIDALTAGLQKVSAQRESGKPHRKRLRTPTKSVGFVKYWEIIADNLSKAAARPCPCHARASYRPGSSLFSSDRDA